MKQLARYYMKRLAFLLLGLSFLISNGISYKIKEEAQSDFAKNTLSFLLMKENQADFIDSLEKFNTNSKDFSIIYLTKDGKKIFNPDRIKVQGLDKLDLENKTFDKNISFYKAFSNQVIYGSRAENTLIIAYENYIGYYINIYLILIHLLLAFIINRLLNKSVDKNVDDYLSNIDYDNYENLIKDNNYSDIRWHLKTYVNHIKYMSEEMKSLKHRLDELNNITGNMKEGFILFDGNGRVELINKAAKTYLGIGEDIHIAKLIEDKEYSLALREASILRRSKILDIKHNGHFLRVFIDPLTSSKKKAYALIIVDNSKDVESEKMRREFSANVSHELKSPLTSINGYAELIATGMAKDDDINKFGEIIYKEGNRLLDIIDDIIKISRLDESNFDKDFVEVDIKDAVDASIEKYERISNKKSIKVKSNIESFKIKTSKSLFYDLVSNIYENAIKYNKVGGSISIESDLVDNTYYLSISDSGIGIDKNHIERIFERFYVVDKSRKRNQKSTGLGLSIVKHIINYLGYDIKVESKLGQGSKFIIEIPLGLDR